MKFVKTFLLGSVTALALSNNVSAQEIIFDSNDLEMSLTNNIELNISDLAKPAIDSEVKRQLSTMELEQNVQQFLSLAKFDETTQKPSVIQTTE